MSPLLTHTQDFFNNQFLRDLLNSAPSPMRAFSQTNTHETQVSRYGDSNQKYDWHIDRLLDNSRLITFSYNLNIIIFFMKQPRALFRWFCLAII